ncbi:MAG: hypothetical protein AAGA56_01695 [Myxococcota bacterium]
MRALVATIALLGLTGCVSGRKAIPSAAYRTTSCDAKKIEVVEQDGHDVVLDVCGKRERWHWNAFNGWAFAEEVPKTQASR